MGATDVQQLVVGTVAGLASSTAFVLALLIGFCVLIGFAKLRQTAGYDLVIRSLDEKIQHKPMTFLSPTAPHGPADQLQAPELVEAAARRSR